MKNPPFLPLVVLVLGLLSPLVAEERRPNVIVIMADDLGFGDLSCYGATTFETPNLDALAGEGLRFMSGYCTASTCTPTRYSLLTGNYAFREKGTGIAPPSAPALIAGGTPTIASMLKSVGYTTAVIATAGFRSPNDHTANETKVRFPLTEVVLKR